VQLLVLLLMFIFLSLQCIVPKARVKVRMSALVVSWAGAQATIGRGTVVIPPSVPVFVSVPLQSRGVADGVCVSWHEREGGRDRRGAIHKRGEVLLSP